MAWLVDPRTMRKPAGLASLLLGAAFAVNGARSTTDLGNVEDWSFDSLRPTSLPPPEQPVPAQTQPTIGDRPSAAGTASPAAPSVDHTAHETTSVLALIHRSGPKPLTKRDGATADPSDTFDGSS